MKIYLANNSKQKVGGGWTFLRTFEKYLAKAGEQVVQSADDADVVFLSGATMVDRDTFDGWKKQGKKIVLRVDNIPRNSRNRNTGTSRLYDFAQGADLVIYQSFWAKDYIKPFILRDGPVILNGADTDFFNTTGVKQPKDGQPQYAYVQFNRDETKQWHQAWYEFIMAFRKNNQAHLWIIGQFSPENVEYNFDFFMGEKFKYQGVIDDPSHMAEFMRSTDVLYLPYYNDACSQTMIEALMCGCVVAHNGTGGGNEIQNTFNTDKYALSAECMTKCYIDEIKNIL